MWFFEFQVVLLLVSQVVLAMMVLWNRQDLSHIDLRKDALRKQIEDDEEERKRLLEERSRLEEEQKRIDEMLKGGKRRKK